MGVKGGLFPPEQRLGAVLVLFAPDRTKNTEGLKSATAFINQATVIQSHGK